MEREILTVSLGTLASLVEGRAGRQFDAALAAIIEAVIDPEAARADGWAKGSVVVTVTLEGQSEEDGGAVSLGVQVDAKPPKMRASAAPLIRAGASYGIDVTPSNQTRLPFRAIHDQE